jgi:hypothetical protein
MGQITKADIGSQDLQLWDGVTGTFTRATSTGDTLTLNKIGGEVDVLMVYGGGVNYTLATIQAAMTAIGATNKVKLVFRPGTWAITDDLTITANLTAYVQPGATFSVTAGKTLAFSGPVIGWPGMFGATGTITVATYPQDAAWWTGATERLDVTGLKVTGLTALSLPYLDANKILASLALGTANQKPIVNAAGTLLEFSSCMSATDHTYDLATATGTQTLTGAGFTPSAAIVLWGMAPGGTAAAAGIGFKMGTKQGCLNVINGGVILGSIDNSFMLVTSTAGHYQYCSLAFNADGGALSWTKSGTPTGTLTFKMMWLR